MSLKLRWYLRNPVGTVFGGSLYSLSDPFYMLLFLKHIGKTHVVWDKKACIEFISPSRDTVHATFEITQEMIDGIVDRCKDGGPVFETFAIDLRDKDGKVVAKVEKVLYFRKKRDKVNNL